MTIVVRAVESSSSAGSTSTALGNIPASTQPGDLLVATIQLLAAAATLAPPAGWTELAEMVPASTTTGSLRGARRRAQAGDAGAALEFGLGASTRWAMNVAAVYDTGGAPVVVEQITTLYSGTQTATPNTPAVTPAAATTVLLGVIGGACNLAGAQPTVTPAVGWTLAGQTVSTTLTLKNAVQALATKALGTNAPVPATPHGLSESTVGPACASIILSSTNAPPIANAGPDRSVPPGATVHLNASGSTDLDGTVTAYLWAQQSGPPVTLTGAGTVDATFTAPATTTGATLTFSLTVTDDRSGIGIDFVTISVAAMGSARARVAGAWEPHPIRLRAQDDWL
ncbi:hypothetical protein BDK92_7258 [Micromonospora pisi]|uniref:Uncharacterized protein n=1 Tax=Micromonospora pisi TaxID=589240 RepID=A0A495JW19_9ACTN|nr:PKD domain-containing protein [Micromonospora pisi]RKR92778.1 hypothetical protein BDK92_7258 [Micromonospora pisi]